jgi:hypothetical protein
MQPKLNFSGEEEKLLIEIVRKNSELFDLSHKKYKDSEHKDNIWLDIANTIGNFIIVNNYCIRAHSKYKI